MCHETVITHISLIRIFDCMHSSDIVIFEVKISLCLTLYIYIAFKTVDKDNYRDDFMNYMCDITSEVII